MQHALQHTPLATWMIVHVKYHTQHKTNKHTRTHARTRVHPIKPVAQVQVKDERDERGGGEGHGCGRRTNNNPPARRLAARLAATEPAMIALPALDKAETAVEAGRYLSTCEAAVLGLPATSVVMPASTETLHHDVYMLCRCIAADSEGGGEGAWLMHGLLKVAGGLS